MHILLQFTSMFVCKFVQTSFFGFKISVSIFPVCRVIRRAYMSVWNVYIRMNDWWPMSIVRCQSSVQSVFYCIPCS